MKRSRVLLKIAFLTAIFILFAAGIGWWWLNRHTVSEIKPSALPDDHAWPAMQFSENDWPCWRGPLGNGESPGPPPPQNWSATTNIKWKREVPGRGHASPIICDHAVYLFTADEEKQQLSLLAYDRDSGQDRWQTIFHTGGFPIKHPKNSHASSTPICDGKHIYCVAAVNDSLQVTAVTVDGKVAWQTEAGPFISENGYGPSPVLWGPYVLVVGDSSPLAMRRVAQSPSFVSALDRHTGAIAWRVKRPLGHSYGSPVILKSETGDQLLLAGPEAIISYNPLNGNERWRYQWPASRVLNTIVTLPDRMIAITSLPSRLTICLKTSGNGQLGEQDVIWKSERYVCDVPTPLLHSERLYLVDDGGIITTLAAGDGKLLWKGRLGSGTAVSASPVIHGNHIYAAAEGGKTFVFEDGSAFKLLATNDLGEEQIATPAIAGGNMFIRTSKHVWCIAESSKVKQ